MRRWKKIVLGLTAAVAVAGCKDVLNPHVTPSGDPSQLVASMAAATDQAIMARSDAQIVLTINNAPEADEPLEQDFLTEIVELFEQKNPNIRIQYSPWQYTPDSFFERLNNRTLTDIIEVDAEQMAPIIEANAAADLTENVKVTPEMRVMNPDVFTVTSKDGRTYGVPTELHTLALFYNRKLFAQSRSTAPGSRQSADKPKGQGAEGDPRAYVEFANLADELTEPALELAQYGRGGAPYAYPPQYQPPQRPRQQDSRGYSNQPPQQSRQQQQQQQYQQYQQQQQEYYRQYYQQYYPQHPQGQPGYQQPGQPPEDARERRVRSRRQREEENESSEGSSSRSGRRSAAAETTSSETLPDDTLTTEAELAMRESRTTASDAVTTVIQTAGLPTDLEQFIRTAVRLTDHKNKIFGFAPVLFASEGGREYAQWCMMAGLDVQKLDGANVEMDIDKSGEVAQFLKDMHHRFDVTPPPNRCFHDNLLTLFAEGNLAMMILPADGETIDALTRRGMSLDDIGISALPRGLDNRDHLTYGRCLVVNSQLDQARRAAAFKWLMFMASPEVKRLRAQFFFRERAMTTPPSVPLYTAAMQAEFYDSVRQYRTLPLWSDYESVIARNLRLQPSFETTRFFESVAEGVRSIVERKDSDPFHAVTLITADFERKYIRGEQPDNMLDRYVHFLMERKEN